MKCSFQDYVERVKPRLDDAFSRCLSGLLDDFTTTDAGPLWANLNGGKKSRGCLLCLVGEGLGASLESALERAVAVELIHIASLIHDDFVDQDRMRRNIPAAWTLEGARRAVLLGDVIFATSIQMMNQMGRDEGLVASETIAQLAGGALHEPLDPSVLLEAIESPHLNYGLYEKIIRLKTGVLFSAACRLGAISAGASREVQDNCYRYGMAIGEAYQIADDLKEVRNHLAAGTVQMHQMVALAPSLLYFDKKLRPHIIAILREGAVRLNDAVMNRLAAAAERMQQAIEQRLNHAVAEIKSAADASRHRELILSAPWELIRMFNAGE
jgi:geranylgeranyl pyrophosphate synthase